MGSVYRARDEALGREVAIKTIHTAGRSAFQIEMFQARFDNEARALAALAHPHVVNVFDVGVEDDTPFLVMELVQGRTLADRLAEDGPMSATEAAVLGRQVAEALQTAHDQGIVHRDVKPGNILEAEPGAWKLADFGIAHIPDSSLTLTGQFLGSPAYAAPEALGEGELGPASDVYGLGATLYECLSGAPPHGKGGLLTMGALAAGSEPQPLAEVAPGVPEPVQHAVMAAIARDPQRRPTAGELAGALGDGPPIASRPVAAAAAPVSTSLVAAWGARSPRRSDRTRNLIIAVAGAALVFGIALGVGLSSDDSTPAAGTTAPQPAAVPDNPPGDDWLGPEERGRGKGRGKGHGRGHGKKDDPEKVRRHVEKEWRKVDQKLHQGKPRDALRHLDKILSRDPGDERARNLYRQLSGSDWDDE
jgi:serine/threonine-protein kinase